MDWKQKIPNQWKGAMITNIKIIAYKIRFYLKEFAQASS